MNVPKPSAPISSDSAKAIAPDSLPPGTGQTDRRASSASEARLRLAFRIDPSDEDVRHDHDRLRALADYHRTGRLPSHPGPGRDGRLPALLFPVLELSALRTAWPAFLAAEEDRPVRTLTDIIDELVSSVEGEGDEARRLRRDLLKIERTIRQMVSDGTDATFSSLWDGAMDLLFGGVNGRDERTKERRDAVAAVKPLPRSSNPVLTCSDGSIQQLAAAINARTRASLTESTRAETDSLRNLLERILEVDDSHAPEKKDSEHLQASVGAGDIDAEALSGLLSGVPLDARLPDVRRRRIELALRTLNELGPRVLGQTRDFASFELPERHVARTAPQAMELASRNARELVEFLRAFHTARLESENRYRPDEHDALLAGYSAIDLTADEQRLQAPVFLITDDVGATRPADLFDLLAGSSPVRILRLRRRVGSPDDQFSSAPPASADSTATPVRVNGLNDRLAVATCSIGSAFVMQTAVSDLDGLADGLSRGLAFDGPVLLDIYTGSPDDAPELPTYLRAAAAIDARVVPSFRYDPSAGDDMASRFTVERNPDPESDWPSSPLPLGDEDAPNGERAERGRSGVMDAAFTAVDLFACDDRFDAHFARIPEDVRHHYLTTVADAISGAEGIPFVLLAGPDGRVHRYAVTRYLIDAAASIRDGWRAVRELGGIRNSHVRLHVGKEAARIAAEKQADIEELTARHERELDRATTAVAETIVSNLAAKLLGLTSARPMPEFAGAPDAAEAERFRRSSTPPADPALSSPPASTPDEQETEDATPADDEAPLLTEEAYIDTPLCTSCNECTNLNGQIFAYDENKQAYIRDASAGPYRDLVVAAEKCPVRIIHPGKPLDPDESGLDDLERRAEAFN